MSVTKSRYDALGNTFGHYKIFLPTNLSIGKNTTFNIVQSHFYDTGISLFQLLDHENQGESLDCHGFIDTVFNIKKLAPLPAEYTQPSKVYRSSEELFAPLFRFNYEELLEYHDVNLVRTEEHQWLQ